MEKHKRLFIVLLAIGVIFLLLLAAAAFYINDFYHASSEAVVAMSSGEEISMEYLDGGAAAFVPDSAEVGLWYVNSKSDRNYKVLALNSDGLR